MTSAVPGGEHGCVAGMLEPCGRPATLAGFWPWSCHPAPVCTDNAPSAAAHRTRRARGEREGNRRLLSICASVCLSVRPPLQHIHQSLQPSIPRTHLLLHPAICPAPGAVNLSVSASPTWSSLPWGALPPDPQGPPSHLSSPLPQRSDACCCSDADTPGPGRCLLPEVAPLALGDEDALPQHQHCSILVPGTLLACRLCARHGHWHCHRMRHVQGGEAGSCCPQGTMSPCPRQPGAPVPHSRAEACGRGRIWHVSTLFPQWSPMSGLFLAQDFRRRVWFLRFVVPTVLLLPTSARPPSPSGLSVPVGFHPSHEASSSLFQAHLLTSLCRPSQLPPP